MSRKRYVQEGKEVMQERQLESDLAIKRSEPRHDRRLGPRIVSGIKNHHGDAECGCGERFVFSKSAATYENMTVVNNVWKIECPACRKVER